MAGVAKWHLHGVKQIHCIAEKRFQRQKEAENHRSCCNRSVDVNDCRTSPANMQQLQCAQLLTILILGFCYMQQHLGYKGSPNISDQVDLK